MIQEMEFRKILNWMAETERIWKRKKTKEKKMEVNLGKKETIEWKYDDEKTSQCV